MTQKDSVIGMTFARCLKSVKGVAIVFVTKAPVPKIAKDGKEKESHAFLLEKSKPGIRDDD